MLALQADAARQRDSVETGMLQTDLNSAIVSSDAEFLLDMRVIIVVLLAYLLIYLLTAFLTPEAELGLQYLVKH